MFKSLDEMIRIRFKTSPSQLRREMLARWTVGIGGAAAGFQAIYSMLLALE